MRATLPLNPPPPLYLAGWMEVPLCTMLAARMEAVICAGVSARLLEACTSWALQNGGPKNSSPCLPDRCSLLLAVKCINRFRSTLSSILIVFSFKTQYTVVEF